MQATKTPEYAQHLVTSPSLTRRQAKVTIDSSTLHIHTHTHTLTRNNTSGASSLSLSLSLNASHPSLNIDPDTAKKFKDFLARRDPKEEPQPPVNLGLRYMSVDTRAAYPRPDHEQFEAFGTSFRPKKEPQSDVTAAVVYF
ncbi:hypothetical protein FZEAL_1025 [Fusarium zealandicum]|uniref:Uncharacterized protein n=1 Tax=Fusarium zealandicum TaxID=1053134 RepID=A0A8H4UTL1_9HYPO|nr:hypothetical protein FZEAL_1025 [Fusarium zealandicum]